MKFSETIVQILKEEGITGNRAASICGITPQKFSDYKTGKYEPRFSDGVKMINLLKRNVSVSNDTKKVCEDGATIVNMMFIISEDEKDQIERPSFIHANSSHKEIREFHEEASMMQLQYARRDFVIANMYMKAEVIEKLIDKRKSK